MKQIKPEINERVKLDIGGGHSCFAVYLGDDIFDCVDGKGSVKLNALTDFEKLKWTSIG